MDKKLPNKAKFLYGICQPTEGFCLVFGVLLCKCHGHNLMYKANRVIVVHTLCSTVNWKHPGKWVQTCSAVHGSEQASPIAVSASLAFPPHFTSPTLSTKPSKTTEAEVLEKFPLRATRATMCSLICITCRRLHHQKKYFSTVPHIIQISYRSIIKTRLFHC